MQVHSNNKAKSLPADLLIGKAGGFSLIEVLIALVILALVTGSVFSAFSGSKSLLYSARELSIATALAGSYLAAVNEVQIKEITSFAPADEAEVPLAFLPASLKLSPAPKPFSRQISLLAIDQTGVEGGPFYQVRVQISWPRKESGKLLSYSSSTIIRGKS